MRRATAAQCLRNAWLKITPEDVEDARKHIERMKVRDAERHSRRDSVQGAEAAVAPSLEKRFSKDKEI